MREASSAIEKSERRIASASPVWLSSVDGELTYSVLKACGRLCNREEKGTMRNYFGILFILLVFAGAIAVPVLSVNVEFCFLKPETLKPLAHFLEYIARGVLPHKMLCSFSNLFLVYLVFVLTVGVANAAFSYLKLKNATVGLRKGFLEKARAVFWYGIKLSVGWALFIFVFCLIPSSDANNGIIGFSPGSKHVTRVENLRDGRKNVILLMIFLCGGPFFINLILSSSAVLALDALSAPEEGSRAQEKAQKSDVGQ